jgi:hypothetical protein
MKYKEFKKASALIINMFVLVALSITTACGQKIKGDGNVVKEERSVSGYTEIDASGALSVTIIQGDAEGVIVEADKNLMDYIITKVSGNTLKLYTKESISNSTKMHVTVKVIKLEGVDISGAVNVNTKGIINTSNFEIDCSGASKIDLKITTQNLEGDISGGSKISLSGTADKFSMDISGAAKVDAFDLKTNICEFDISGAAKAEIYCSDKLEAEISGTAKIVYKGNPSVESDVSGVASIEKY